VTAEDLLAAHRIVPVVVLDNANDAVPLARTLCAAGITSMEITLRTDCAVEAIERVAEQVPEMTVGAGSIRQPAQFQQVKDAGARFCVSPGCSEMLLSAAAAADLPFVPGAATASEMIRLLDADFRLVKFFPAQINGGVAAIKALSAPLPELRFFPTGGITPDNLSAYLSCEAVMCVGGSWFVPGDAIRRGAFSEIGSMAAAAVALAGV